MGLNQVRKTPCGFCFIEYYSRASAMTAINFLHNTLLDSKELTVNSDPGMSEGRQYGRGISGYQRRDETNFFKTQTELDDRMLDVEFVKKNAEELKKVKELKYLEAADFDDKTPVEIDSLEEMKTLFAKYNVKPKKEEQAADLFD